LIRKAKRRGFLVKGIEPARQTDFEASVAPEIFVGQLRDAHLESDSFDVICLIHSLEHMRDPIIELRECLRLLRSSGCLVIRVPSVDALSAALFRDKYGDLQVPLHLSFFTDRTLRLVLDRAGFEVRELRRNPLLGTIPRSVQIFLDGYGARLAAFSPTAAALSLPVVPVVLFLELLTGRTEKIEVLAVPKPSPLNHQPGSGP
jgi:SAM-dependent methyltransferase